MTIKEAQSLLGKQIGNIETYSLLEYILKVDKQYIYVNYDKKITKKQEYILKKSLKKLQNGEPLQYITKKAHFMGMEFAVNKSVLIPQPDTETLVEETLKIIETLKGKKLRILDLCTGSGAIAISLAKYAKDVEITAVDISYKALRTARKNYKKLINNGNKVKFLKSNMFDKINGKFDLIVSNPPYIETEVIKTLDKQVQKEPKIALDGGKDGLQFYRIIRKNVDKHLFLGGTLLMEIGYNQKEKVQEIFENSFCIKDLAGNDRVITWRR